MFNGLGSAADLSQKEEEKEEYTSNPGTKNGIHSVCCRIEKYQHDCLW